jgi:DNA-binding beta-propeller fold protein YncE
VRKALFLFSLLAIFAAITYSSCRQDVPVIDNAAAKYPEKIGNIILTKCAVSGCHNAQSKDAAAGLDLSSWSSMMEGDRNGAVCIPYSADYSTMFLFTNTYSDLGTMVEPTMPNNNDPLSRDQVRTIRDWINAGAPNSDGFVKWSDNPNRQKYYVTLQGCDAVCAVDAETKLQMRYIPVGATSAIESPHNIKISPDGQYWYCSFLGGRYLEKHRTSDDAMIARILLGPTDSAAVGSWNTFSISPDSRYAYVVDWRSDGRVARVDLQTNHWLQTYQGSNLFIYPHGSAVSADGNFLYLTSLTTNFIYRVDISVPQLPSVDMEIIDGSGVPNNGGPTADRSHDILFSPDGTRYFVTSEHIHKVRIMDPSTDPNTLIATIDVGDLPQEMAVSSDPSTPYLYVTCMEDTTNFPGYRGSVAVINWQTGALVTSINTGYQPHGVTVDDDRKIVFVANRNNSTSGPAPHHSTSCIGRNGYFSLIDMNTNTLISGSRTELIVDPYSAVYRR